MNSLRDNLTIEVTASSASVNKQADRQDALMLVQVLGQYYDKTLQLATVTLNPMTPPELKDVANKVAKASSLAIERLLRTFDNVRDPKQFIPEIADPQQQQPLGGPAQGEPGSTPGNPEVSITPAGGGTIPSGDSDPIDADVSTGGVLGDTSAIR